VYDEPTVLVAKRVTGEEEVPDGVVAVLTPDAPDVLSHLSVRARNMRVLFAICHDAAPLKEVEDRAGKVKHPLLVIVLFYLGSVGCVTSYGSNASWYACLYFLSWDITHECPLSRGMPWLRGKPVLIGGGRLV
jgi:hypothetical protein